MSTNEARAFELVFEGRPVAWDRTGIGRDGRLHNRPKPLLHRRELAKAMRFAEGRRAFEGPVKLTVLFNYRRNETTIRVEDCSVILYEPSHLKGGGKSARADVDNLVKQVMEAAEFAGIVADDVQFVSVTAEKVG